MTGTRKAFKRIIRLLANIAVLAGILIACNYLYLDGEEIILILGLYLAAWLIIWVLAKIVRGIRLGAEKRRERKREDTTAERKNRAGSKRTAAVLLAALICSCGAVAVKKYMEIPDALLELKRKYPETSEFVNAYPWKKNRQYDMDISRELVGSRIPLFIQWDERWGYESYGNNIFAVNACGPTSLSMVVCGLTGSSDANPYQVAQYSEAMGYYVPGEGTSWNLMTEGAESYGLTVEGGEPSEEYISGALSDGSVLICSMWPGDFTYSGHFIVLTGQDEQGNIIVNDPNSIEKSERSWPLDVLLPQIRAVWGYSYN